MSSINIPPSPRAHPRRHDLRAEINQVANYNLRAYYGIEGLSLSRHSIQVRHPGYIDFDTFHAMSPKEQRSVRDPYSPGVTMYRERFDALVAHEKQFGKLSGMADDDRELAGVNVRRDGAWPACRDCGLPFVTMLNGHQGYGVWVCRIEDGDPLCECCWLAETYSGDRQMIEHVLRWDFGGKAMRLSVRADLRRYNDVEQVFRRNVSAYWQSPGLFELLRLHRVSLTASAGVILHMLESLIAEIRLDERVRREATITRKLEREKQMAPLWLEEQRNPNTLTTARRMSA
jgi:hypothetical protein